MRALERSYHVDLRAALTPPPEEGGAPAPAQTRHTGLSVTSALRALRVECVVAGELGVIVCAGASLTKWLIRRCGLWLRVCIHARVAYGACVLTWVAAARCRNLAHQDRRRAAEPRGDEDAAAAAAYGGAGGARKSAVDRVLLDQDLDLTPAMRGGGPGHAAFPGGRGGLQGQTRQLRTQSWGQDGDLSDGAGGQGGPGPPAAQ